MTERDSVRGPAAETETETETESAATNPADRAVVRAGAPEPTESEVSSERPRAPRYVRQSRVFLHLMLALLVLGAVVAAVVGALTGDDSGLGEPRVLQVQGVELRTNLVEATGSGAGVVYFEVPVNTAIDEIVLETGDAEADDQLESFVAGIDTLVPGEHSVTVSGIELRVVVDGISEG